MRMQAQQEITHPIGVHLLLVNNRLETLSKRTHFTKGQIIVCSICFFFILLGQFMNKFSPIETIENYFTSPGNIVNTYYVKKGWFWTIAIYFCVSFRYYSKETVNKKLLIRSLLRVFFFTICWFFFTQWFFGAPIMDKVFVWTGGQCANVNQDKIPDALKRYFKVSADIAPDLFQSAAVSSATCRLLKGNWDGGHDPSGHVFLLTLSVIILILESLELFSLDESYVSPLDKAFSWKEFFLHPLIILGLAITLELTMFLMTIIRYHSFVEQLGGFAFAFLAVWLVNKVTEITQKQLRV